MSLIQTPLYFPKYEHRFSVQNSFIITTVTTNQQLKQHTASGPPLAVLTAIYLPKISSNNNHCFITAVRRTDKALLQHTATRQPHDTQLLPRHHEQTVTNRTEKAFNSLPPPLRFKFPIARVQSGKGQRGGGGRRRLKGGRALRATRV